MGLRRNALALYLPVAPAELCIYADHVVDSMENNVLFPSPSPPLPVIEAASEALRTAAAAARGLGEGGVAARKVAQKKLEDLLISEKAYVQDIINKNPDDALTIAQEAGMWLRQRTPFHKAPLAAKLGPGPNQALVTAKAVHRGAAYEWQYSLDGGQTWVTIGITNSAHVILPGVTLGATYFFRFRTTVRNKVSDWSSTVSFTAR